VRAVVNSNCKGSTQGVFSSSVKQDFCLESPKALQAAYGPLAEKVRAKLYGDKPTEVLDGPFKGLKFVGQSDLGPIIPKWIGIYESKLHPIIKSVSDTRDYRTIIDIGAAEGYYSVGLAWRLPHAAVYSYDIDASARRTQRWLAHVNGVRWFRVSHHLTASK
jgi:hypothetical protein